MTYDAVVIGGKDWEVLALEVPFPGKGQDAFAVGRHSIAVVDGATPLEPSWPQDVAAFARQAAEELVREADKVAIGPVSSNIWSPTISNLAARFPPAGFKRTASAAVVFGHDDQLFIEGVGDVCVLVDTLIESVKVMDDFVVCLDKEAKESSNPNAQLVVNRSRANRPDGYPILGDDPSVGARVTRARFEAAEVRSMWLMSDGFWRHLPNDPGDAVRLLNRLRGESLLAVAGQPIDDLTVIELRPAEMH